MKKYLRIYSTIVKNSVSYEAQYRRDTWLQFTTNLLWLGLLSLTIETIFRHTPELLGWQKEEVYLLTIIWVIIDELYTMMAKRNLLDIPNLVTDGALDFYLTKPVNCLFLVSTKIFLIRAVYRLLLQLGLLTWLIINFDLAFTWWHVTIATLLVLSGVATHYACSLILNTLSFWWLRIDNVNEAWDSINSLGRYPLSVLPKYLKIVMLTIIPIAFIGYVPTATLTGRAPWYLVVYAFLFTAGLFVLAVKFWHFAVRRYSSASS